MRLDEPPLDALLMGAGGMGAVWLAALASEAARPLGVRLRAVCDLDAARAEAAVAAALGAGAVPVEAALDRALDRGAELVIDCTTPDARLAVAGEALRRGRHVLCEKPLAADEATAARLLGLAARSPGRLAVSQNRRFQPGLRQMRAAVASGALGAPRTLSATLHMAPRFGGFREAMAHVMLRDMAIHAFDAARAILGSDAGGVVCVERSPRGSRFAHGAEAHALFEMACGALFSFAGSWDEAGPPTSWNGAWRLSLSGGAVRWDGEGSALAWAAPPEEAPGLMPEARPVELPPAGEGPWDILGSLASVVGAIRAGRAPETEVRGNARSLAMVLAAIRSAEAHGAREPVRALGPAAETAR